MGTAASVLACALSVLGRSEASMPPIELIDMAPPDVSSNAEAFVRRDTGTIYLITSSAVFKNAATVRDQCGYSDAMRKLASILAHEEWHVRHGPDEKAAYEQQLITLIRLGVGPGTGIYRSVQVSMLKVLDARKRNRPERVLASR
jgi:hypothetical protein